jgi:cold shock CspA family protein/ribosome-associated translation inhibitor RaiA
MLPLRLTVHNTTLSADERADIRARMERLQRYYDRITDCRVTVTVPQRRRRTDRKLYGVRVALTVPMGSLVVDRQPRQTLATALDDAFQAARRRLQDHARRMGGFQKAHGPPPVGRVVEWFPLAGYGFIETSDGDRFYFDGRAVTGNAAGRLDVGTAVRFEAEQGRRGPQASTVTITRARWRARPEAALA